MSKLSRREFLVGAGATVVAASAPGAFSFGRRRGGEPKEGGVYSSEMTSDVYRMEMGGKEVPVKAVPGIPATEYPALAEEYAKLPSYCSIWPSNFMGVHYVWLTAEGALSLTVTCPNEVKRCVVHPARRKAKIAIDGKRVTLALGDVEPRYYVVEIDDYPPLAIMIDPPEQDVVQRKAHGVADLSGAVSAASVEARTKALEEGIRRAVHEGKIAFIPAGVHEVGPIRVHGLKGVRIYMEPGCVLQTEVSPAGKNVHSHGLWVQDCEDVQIWGRGCIDHQGFGNWAHGRNNYNHGLISYYVTNELCPFTTESPVFLLRCRRVEIEGLLVKCARNFDYNVRRCDDVVFRHCKMLTPPASAPEYGDGFHTNSCVNVRIENCFAYCNDDCFASGHYTHFDDRESAGHEIVGLVGWNPRANAVRLGWHSYYNLGDFRFENCDFGGMVCSVVVVHPLKDAPEAHRYQRYGTVSFRNCGFDTGRVGDALVDMADARMERFEIVDSVFEDRKPIRIHGHGADDGVKVVNFKGTTAGGKAIAAGDVDATNVGEVGI